MLRVSEMCQHKYEYLLKVNNNYNCDTVFETVSNVNQVIQ